MEYKGTPEQTAFVEDIFKSLVKHNLIKENEITPNNALVDTVQEAVINILKTI